MCPEAISAAENVIVRPCKREDLNAILEILGQVPEAANWSAGALKHELQHNSKYFLIASKGQEIAGFALGREIDDQAEILNLALKSAYRRQGIGKALVRKLLTNFQEDGVTSVFLEVRESNTPAIDFYRVFGFVQSGKRLRYYQNPPEDALVFVLQIRDGNSPQSKLP
jgi:[ribosomal protein S18]-alanine N-acetyltransferase